MTDKPFFFQKIIFWYDAHRRDLPWRAKPSKIADPYHVWLSEIMLQQTTVPTVKSYFDHFLQLWPTVADLAAAPLDDILHAWQGLGYYRRAHNLHKCAQTIVRDFGGSFPNTQDQLLTLPGIGPYTAAAISAIAFDKPAIVIDGNVERVVARFAGLEDPLPHLKKSVYAFLSTLNVTERSGDFAQAKMDLGSMICKPKNPLCTQCPLLKNCCAHKKNLQGDLPRPAPKKKKPTLYGHVFWHTRLDGAILLEKRPDQGLLGGMVGFPSTPWSPEAPSAPLNQLLPGEVTHTFTHFTLKLQVLISQNPPPIEYPLWVPPDQFHTLALPTVMKKIAKHALNALYMVESIE